MKKIIILILLSVAILAQPVDQRNDYNYDRIIESTYALPNKEVVTLSEFAKNIDGSKLIERNLSTRKLPLDIQADAYLRIAIFLKKIDRHTAELVYENLQIDDKDTVSKLSHMVLFQNQKLKKDLNRVFKFVKIANQHGFNTQNIQYNFNSNLNEIESVFILLKSHEKTVSIVYDLHKPPQKELLTRLIEKYEIYFDRFDNVDARFIYFRNNKSIFSKKTIASLRQEFSKENIYFGTGDLKEFFNELKQYSSFVKTDKNIFLLIGLFLLLIVVCSAIFIYSIVELRKIMEIYDKGLYAGFALFALFGVIMGILLSKVMNLNIMFLTGVILPVLVGLGQIVLIVVRDKGRNCEKTPLFSGWFPWILKIKEVNVKNCSLLHGYSIQTFIAYTMMGLVTYLVTVSSILFASEIKFISSSSMDVSYASIAKFSHIWESLFPFAVPQAYEHLGIRATNSEWAWFFLVTTFGMIVWKSIPYCIISYKLLGKIAIEEMQETIKSTVSFGQEQHNLIFWKMEEVDEQDIKRIAPDLQDHSNLKTYMIGGINETIADRKKLVGKEGNMSFFINFEHEYYKGGLKILVQDLSKKKNICIYLIQKDHNNQWSLVDKNILNDKEKIELTQWVNAQNDNIKVKYAE